MKRIKVKRNYKFIVKGFGKVALNKTLKKFYKKCKYCGEIKLVNKFESGRNKCRSCRSDYREKRYNDVLKYKYIHVCDYCNKQFSSANKNSKYCSVECQGKSYKKVIECKCNYCGKEIEIKPNKYKKNKNNFCNIKCMGKWRSENITGKNSPLFRKVECNCSYCGELIEVSQNRYNTLKNHFCNIKCMGKWKSKNCIGEKNPNWNCNISQEEREQGRNIDGYKEFIKDTLKRDNYTCQYCGQISRDLNVHHLNSYHWDKENRTNINNGITLCSTCHNDFHNIYGRKNNTKEQFYEYINNKTNESA